MEEALETQLPGSIFIAGVLALLAFFVAKRLKYFRLPAAPTVHYVLLRHVLGAFAVYLIVAIFAFSLLGLAVKTVHPDYIPQRKDGWIILLQIIVCGALVGYLFLVRRDVRKEIFWGGQKPSSHLFWKSFGLGALSWLVSYPFVLLTNTLAVYVETMIWGRGEVEQVAVTQLKEMLGNPLLFVAMLLIVVLLVPFVEELLFRGFLQSFLRKYLGRRGGIGVTAAIFALVHYAPSQGTGNFQLILSLFVLSLFLSFLYERERTLWAPIGLHTTFNLISALWISFSGQ